MFRKRASGILCLAAALFLLGACGDSKLKMKSFSLESFPNQRLEGGMVYYVEVAGNINVPGMGAIFYKNTVPDKEGKEIIVLVNGISENIWQKVIPSLVQAGGFIAGNAVYGVSLPTAKMAVSTAVTATGGSPTSTASGGSSTSTATGGSSTSTATGGTATSTSTANPTANACTGNNAC